MRRLAMIYLMGCTVGGGPVVGYGEKGFFGGGEVNGGLGFPLEATVGFQSRDHRVYGFVEGIFDMAGQSEKWTPGGRIGGGYSANGEGVGGGVFVIGPSVGIGDVRYHSDGTYPCGSFVDAFAVSLELRYAGEWQIALAPRYERQKYVCIQ